MRAILAAAANRASTSRGRSGLLAPERQPVPLGGALLGSSAIVAIKLLGGP
jgi:hypothetical protein